MLESGSLSANFATSPAPVASQPAVQPTHQAAPPPAQAPQQSAQQPAGQAFNDFDDEIPCEADQRYVSYK